MDLSLQKRLAAKALKRSKKRIKFDLSRLDDIKESITKQDIRELVAERAIMGLPKGGTSRFNARKRIIQRRKGRQQGFGSRKGRHGARQPSKAVWINSIRLQRAFLKGLKVKNLISSKDYRGLYLKSKGGLFRSLRHMKLYITERNLIKK